MHPKIMIVGTVPYNKRSTSRAFEAYFHNWEKENCAQIFSNTRTPCKGHCGTLFQITDQRMLKRRFDKKEKTGKIFKFIGALIVSFFNTPIGFFKLYNGECR